MAQFRYKAFDAMGTLLEGDIEALSVLSAGELVRARGLTPFELIDGSQSSEKWWQRDLFAKRTLTRAAVAAFTRDLAILLEAKIILGDALSVVSAQAAHKEIRALSKRLRDEVVKGRSLSDALLDSHVVGGDYISVVKAGEMSGALGEVFGELATLHERRMEIDGKIKSALVYPAILAVMGMLSVGVIASVLVPSIAPIFIENGKPLPPFVAAVLIARDNAALESILLFAGVCTVAALRSRIKRNAGLRERVHARQLRIPIVGGLILHRETARFARTLGTLMKSGVPIMSGFASATSGVSNVFIKASLQRSLEDLREGRSLATALKRQKVFPSLAIQMVAAGEEIGQLPQLLMRVASLFEERGCRRTDRLLSLLTPALTISIAALVGVLIMSVMSAVLGLNDLAAQ